MVGVFGAFDSQVLVALPTETAVRLFAGPLEHASPTGLVEAVDRDLKAMAKASAEGKKLASSALAASARAMALEIENPFNSATSKSMCATGLRDALAQLRELMPAESEEDGVDDLARRRAQALAGGAAS